MEEQESGGGGEPPRQQELAEQRSEGLPGPGWKCWAVVKGSSKRRPAGESPCIFYKESGLSAGANGRGFPTEMTDHSGSSKGLHWSAETAGRKQEHATRTAP